MFWLPEKFDISSSVKKKIAEDFERCLREFPADLPAFILGRYGFDISGCYGSRKTKIVFGKASGQLSLKAEQVLRDGKEGLGFVVLKTVIAQDSKCQRAMGERAIPSSRMKVEKIRGESGKMGWTVTWKGRGWEGSFGEYLEFMHSALKAGHAYGMLVIPSCAFPLPGLKVKWRIEEYAYTLKKFIEVWESCLPRTVFILEANFSPTLAGSEKASDKELILYWLSNITRVIKAQGRVELGIKVMNAIFDDSFQVEMLRTLAEAETRPDFIVYANRLFDPDKTFEGQKGIAFGGPELSSRNLKVLTNVCQLQHLNQFPEPPPLSATGDIHSGRMALEYILRGAESCQVHTLFQLPGTEYPMKTGSRTARGLHRLFFSPDDGLIASMQYCRERWGEFFSKELPSILQISAFHKNRDFCQGIFEGKNSR